MKSLLLVAVALAALCVGCTNQHALSPQFKERGIEAFDSIRHFEEVRADDASQYEARELAVETAVDAEHRVRKTKADAEVDRLLQLYFVYIKADRVVFEGTKLSLHLDPTEQARNAHVAHFKAEATERNRIINMCRIEAAERLNGKTPATNECVTANFPTDLKRPS